MFAEAEQYADGLDTKSGLTRACRAPDAVRGRFATIGSWRGASLDHRLTGALGFVSLMISIVTGLWSARPAAKVTSVGLDARR